MERQQVMWICASRRAQRLLLAAQEAQERALTAAQAAFKVSPVDISVLTRPYHFNVEVGQ